MKPIFLKIFSEENVAKDLAQLLAKTWYPYLFSVLRNLPHKVCGMIFWPTVQLTDAIEYNCTAAKTA